MGVAGQTGQELADLGFAHFDWVPLPMEEDEAFDPADIGFPCFGAEMSSADSLVHAVKQPGLWRGWDGGNRGGHNESPFIDQ